MPLSCKGVFLVLLVSTLGCKGVSEPATIAADFALDNINGRPLPTFVSPIPETPSIISATLHFDVSGRVVMTELQQDMIQGEVTVTNTLDYIISGNRVEIGCFRPIPANMLCAANFSGTISGDVLSLTIDPNQPVIYNYKIAPAL
jgi:hypothetical protein